MDIRLKKILFQTFLYDLYRPVRDIIALKSWESRQTLPLPFLRKREVILTYAMKYSLGVLVETGTCLGDMVSATRKVFKQIYSIELDDFLYSAAKKRFSKYSNIEIIHGDSGEEIGKIIKKSRNRAYFG